MRYPHPYVKPGRPTRPAMDAGLNDETLDKCMDFLKSRLSPGDVAMLKELIAQGGETGEDEEAPDDKTKAAEDDPPPFKGKPNTGGTVAGASDSKGTFADRWPGVARITVW